MSNVQTSLVCSVCTTTKCFFIGSCLCSALCLLSFLHAFFSSHIDYSNLYFSVSSCMFFLPPIFSYIYLVFQSFLVSPTFFLLLCIFAFSLRLSFFLSLSYFHILDILLSFSTQLLRWCLAVYHAVIQQYTDFTKFCCVNKCCPHIHLYPITLCRK